jgi:hypothetical protein
MDLYDHITELLDALVQMLAKFICKEPDGEDFQFCGFYSLCYDHSVLQSSMNIAIDNT